MIAHYLRERFRPIFLPLTAVIALTASAFRVRWPDAIFDAGFALLLLAQFRTWDDLADREHDAARHPDRTLVRAGSVTQVVAFCGALAVLNICLAVWRDGTGLAVGVIGALNLALGVWYLARTRRTLPGEALLLAKYPAMVVIVAGHRVFDGGYSVLAGAALLYGAVCAYEAWHDPASPLTVSIGGRS